jgi:SAM-dependent methyltransferase
MEQKAGKDSWMMRLYRSKLMSLLLYSHSFFLRRELKNCRRVLDIGSGINSPLLHCGPGFSLAVDRFEPALKEAKAGNTHRAYILADAAHMEFKPRSFDAVVLCELLEHIDKNASLNLLEKAEGWAIKKVLVSSPNGYLPYPYEAMHGNPYQAHRSGWEIREMRERGYKAYGLVGLRFRPFPSSVPISIIWAFFSVLLQCVTYYFPKAAFWVFYAKDKETGGMR